MSACAVGRGFEKRPMACASPGEIMTTTARQSVSDRTETVRKDANEVKAQPAPLSDKEMNEREQVRQIRKRIVDTAAPAAREAAAPIRAMARIVREVEAECRRQGISEVAIAAEVQNRSIGDVDVRLIRECEPGAAPGSLGDYSTIGEDLGIILPGEEINGHISTGAEYLRLRERMTAFERQLLSEYNFDVRIYDVYGVGNPLLRDMLAETYRRTYELPLNWQNTYASIGALNALDHSIRSLGMYYREKYQEQPALCFPAPGFGVVTWQAQVSNLALIMYQTQEEDGFKLTAANMEQLLATNPNLRLLYLTISNNPTAFSYDADELRALWQVIAADGREMVILADTAYIGTGRPAEDKARMRAFLDAPGDIINQTIFINSFSKIYALTGDRFGWCSTTSDTIAMLIAPSWNNALAGLPAEWQLRFMAYVELFKERPEIQQKIRNLYHYRRERLRQELEQVNSVYHVFDQVGVDDDTTIYNWSKLAPDEDSFSLFQKTGIAGVSGSSFGYDDRYLRTSVGFRPADY